MGTIGWIGAKRIMARKLFDSFSLSVLWLGAFLVNYSLLGSEVFWRDITELAACLKMGILEFHAGRLKEIVKGVGK